MAKLNKYSEITVCNVSLNSCKERWIIFEIEI